MCFWQILSCGNDPNINRGQRQQCYSLEKDGWKEHSRLIRTAISRHQSLSMGRAAIVFGRSHSQVLMEGSKTWKEGPQHPNGQYFGTPCIVGISKDEFVVLGGYENGEQTHRVFKYKNLFKICPGGCFMVLNTQGTKFLLNKHENGGQINHYFNFNACLWVPLSALPSAVWHLLFITSETN